jgi:hypothetical protein
VLNVNILLFVLEYILLRSILELALMDSFVCVPGVVSGESQTDN